MFARAVGVNAAVSLHGACRACAENAGPTERKREKKKKGKRGGYVAHLMWRSYTHARENHLRLRAYNGAI